METVTVFRIITNGTDLVSSRWNKTIYVISFIEQCKDHRRNSRLTNDKVQVIKIFTTVLLKVWCKSGVFAGLCKYLGSSSNLDSTTSSICPRLITQ